MIAKNQTSRAQTLKEQPRLERFLFLPLFQIGLFIVLLAINAGQMDVL